MFGTRDLPELTLEDVAKKVTPPGQVIRASTDDITFVLTGDEDPGVRIRTGPETHEELPSAGSIAAFSDLLDIPSSFIHRTPHDLTEIIINHLLQTKHKEVRIRYGDLAIHDISDAQKDMIEPLQSVEIAANVLGEDAQVLAFWSEGGEFRLDVTSGPQGLVGGDKKVGDITHGGLRFTQDLKKRMMPQAQKLLYRLVCTNGMEVEDKTAKVDGRGKDPEEFLYSFEAVCRRLYAEVERDIEHFYNLRNEPLGDASQAVLRLTREFELPDRQARHLTEMVPDAFPDEDASRFDLVNFFTNAALEPGLPAGVARRLERIGGQIVNDHAARCNKCSSKLTA